MYLQNFKQRINVITCFFSENIHICMFHLSFCDCFPLQMSCAQDFKSQERHCWSSFRLTASLSAFARGKRASLDSAVEHVKACLGRVYVALELIDSLRRSKLLTSAAAAFVHVQSAANRCDEVDRRVRVRAERREALCVR